MAKHEKSCGIKIFKYVWQIFNIMHEKNENLDLIQTLNMQRFYQLPHWPIDIWARSCIGT